MSVSSFVAQFDDGLYSQAPGRLMSVEARSAGSTIADCASFYLSQTPCEVRNAAHGH
ncbi:MAG: hypothetical protein VYA30_07790 [Myxococcota bacterium]|nr:hypothetical protein [Myxococcota bacterium]